MSENNFIIDDRMEIEKESEKFINAISDEDREIFKAFLRGTINSY